jgi:hypothetical protein
MSGANLDDIRGFDQKLKTTHSGRNKLWDKMEQIFFMDWSERERVEKAYDDVRLTLSPDGRNQLLGAVRLMVATDPQWSIPNDANNVQGKAVSDNIEKACRIMWNAAGKIAGAPVHYDAILSGLLYDQANLSIISTADMLAHAEKKSKSYAARVKAVHDRTPYLFEVDPARECYADFDRLGLSAHLRSTRTTIHKILADWGERAAFLEEKKNHFTELTLNEHWDDQYHVVYLESGTREILNEEHGLSFIPKVVASAEGSRRLFRDIEQQLQPFLYTLSKSELWERQNLALTVMFTLLFRLGGSPLFSYQRSTPGKNIEIDLSKPFGIVNLEPGESFGAIMKQVVDPTLFSGLEIADNKITESTLYKQALGQPLGGADTYSTVALLSQAGRLPLVSPQARLSWAMGGAMEIALKWLRDEGKQRKVSYGNMLAELKPSDIPEQFELDCKLDITLPQDKLQLANIFNILTQGDNPKVSMRWGRENIINVGQSDEMQKEIWDEQASNLAAMTFFADQEVQLKQLIQQLLTPAPQAPLEVGGAVPPGQEMQPGQMPLEQQGMEPQLEGLPPEMGMNGNQGPMMPPEQGGQYAP